MSECKPKWELYSVKKHGRRVRPTEPGLWPVMSRHNALMYCEIDDNNNLTFDNNIVGPKANEIFLVPSLENYKFEVETTIRRVSQYLHMPVIVDCSLIDKVTLNLTSKFPVLLGGKMELSVAKLMYLNCNIADELKKDELCREHPPQRMSRRERIY